MASSSCFPKIVEEKQNKNIRDGAVAVLGDKSKCIFDGPPGPGSPTPLEGTWDSIDWQQNDALRFTYALTFSSIAQSMKYNIQFISYCTQKGSNRSAVASVATTIEDHINYFEVEKTLYADHTEEFPDFEITCDAESKSGPYQYKFDGVCLVIDGGYYIKRK